MSLQNYLQANFILISFRLCCTIPFFTKHKYFTIGLCAKNRQGSFQKKLLDSKNEIISKFFSHALYTCHFQKQKLNVNCF